MNIYRIDKAISREFEDLERDLKLFLQLCLESSDDSTDSIKEAFDSRSQRHIDILVKLINFHGLRKLMVSARGYLPQHYDSANLPREIRKIKNLAANPQNEQKYMDVKDEKYFGSIETVTRLQYNIFWMILCKCFRELTPEIPISNQSTISSRKLNLTDAERNEKTIMFEKYEKHGSKSDFVFKSGPDADSFFSDFGRSLSAINYVYKNHKIISYRHSDLNRKTTIHHFKMIQRVKEYRVLWEEFGLKPLTLPAIWTPKAFHDCPIRLQKEIILFLIMWKSTNMPNDLKNYVIDRIVDQHVIII